MKFKGLMRKVSTFLLAGMLMIGSAMPAYAADDLKTVCSELESWSNSSEAKKSDAFDEASDYWNNTVQDSSGIRAVEVTFDGVKHNFDNVALTGTQVDPNYKVTLEKMVEFRDKGKGTTTTGPVKDVSGAKENLNAMTEQLGVEADIVGGAKSLESITPLVSQLTGSIIVIVLIGLSIFTAFDIFYLVMPVAKNKMDSAAQSGNRMTTRTDKSTGEAKFRWVTDDAIAAYEEGSQSGGNPIWLYLKKRVISYVAVSVVVFILMTGNVSMIVSFVLQLLSSVFDMFSSLAI